MKNHRYIFILYIVTAFLIIPILYLHAGDKSSSPESSGHDQAKENNKPQSITWYKHSEGLKIARQKKLPALVYFFGDHCRYCEVMEKTEFSKPEFIEYISGHFIPVKVHFQKEPDLVKTYKLFGPPAIYFLSSEGQAVFYSLGYISPDKLRAMLSYVGEGHNKTKTFVQYEKERNK